MNNTPAASNSFASLLADATRVPEALAKMADNLFPLPSPRLSPAEHDARHRAICLTLAVSSLPQEADIYDRIAAADYLENGVRGEEEPPQCSCQTAEATHPRGDEAYCEMRQ